MILALAVGSAPASAFEKTSRSTSDEFQLAGVLTSETVWQTPSNECTLFDRFEQSPPSPAPRIVLGNGSVHDRLLDLIAAAEAGPKGYKALEKAHPKYKDFSAGGWMTRSRKPG